MLRQRLDRLDASLTPTQAVLRWLEEAHQHGSFAAYARWLCDQPASAHPMARLPRQVRRPIEQAMRGAQREDVGTAVRRVQRDVTFLYRLVLTLNSRVLENERAASLGFLWLLERFRGRVARAAPSRDTVARWKDAAQEEAGRVYALAAGHQVLAQRYFEGHPVLFPEEAAWLAAAEAAWDRLLTLYCDRLHALPFVGKEALLLRPEVGRNATEQRARADEDCLVRLAKAETLDLLDECAGAVALVAEIV
jgi:hypothetical protein